MLVLTTLKRSLLIALIVSSTVPAFGHSVVPLPSHFGVSHFALGHHSFTTTHGTGSIATRLNTHVVKTLVTTGFSNGQNLAVSQEVGGAVSSGIINGTLYGDTVGSAYPTSGVYNYAIGSNPYNTGALFGGPQTISNSLTFVNGGVGPIGHGGGAVTKPIRLTGAGRILDNYYKVVSGKATNAGIHSIQTLGPVTGGEFYGTFFENSGSSLYPYAHAAIAFGNNPYNGAFASLPNSALANYVTFGNVTRTVTGGQLSFSIFQSTSPYFGAGAYGIAFGNSAFFGSTAAVQYALFKNAINFVPLATLTHH